MEQSEIFLMLGRMDAKLDTVLSNQAAQDTRMDGHEERIGKLEKKQTFILGAATAASTIVSLIIGLVAFFWDKVKWH